MIFDKKYSFASNKSVSEVRNVLVGKHVNIHNLDFEITAKDRLLKVIPHAEHEEKLRILPITHLEINEKGNGTVINMFTKPRRIDVGGPYLLLIFCVFIILAGIILYLFKGETVFYPAVGLVVAGVLVFIIFWMNIQRTYFDYVRKIRDYVKNKVQ